MRVFVVVVIGGGGGGRGVVLLGCFGLFVFFGWVFLFFFFSPTILALDIWFSS